MPEDTQKQPQAAEIVEAEYMQESTQTTVMAGKRGANMNRAGMSVDFLTRIVDRLDAKALIAVVVLFGTQFLLSSLNIDLGETIGTHQRNEHEYRLRLLEVEQLELERDLLQLQLQHLRLVEDAGEIEESPQ